MKQEKVSLQEAVADACVARLCALGVTDVVLSPGRRNAPLLIAFSRSSLSITRIVDERAAGFFALGLSRSSDRPVVMCCTSGSAAANYLPSIVEAYHSNIPLLVMSADRPEKLHGRGSAQTMRQDNLYGHFTGAALQLPLQSGQARIDSAFDEIENRLTQRLPAHLNIEFDEPLWTCAPSVNRAEAALPRRPLSTVFKSKDFECLFEENGVILCGADTVRDSTGRQAILDLAQHLSWPVFAEAASNVRFGSPDDGVLSCYEALIRSEAITDLKPSSFLRFGRSAMSRAVSEWLLEVAAGRMTTVGVGVEIHDPDELATHHVRAQPMDYAAAALRELPVRASGDWALRWMRREAKARTILDAELEKSWWEGAIASALCESLSSGDVLHVANSMPIRDVDAFAASRGPRIEVFANRGLGGIDGSLATAAGELAGRPDRCLAVLVGDLAFLYDASSLTLLREKRATVLVVDNVGGGIFGFLPMSKGDDVSEDLVFTPPSVDPADIARGYGAQVDVVETMKQLRQALSKALARNGLNVIVARVSREENIAIHGKVWDDLAKKMGRLS